MKIEKTRVYGLEPALRGMRNARESWDKSDSTFFEPGPYKASSVYDPEIVALEYPVLGPEDLKLANTLVMAGGSERKFLRQIQVWADLTLPRYIWVDWDTYKIATVRNSCGSMFHLGHRDLTPSDFQDEVVEPEALALLNLMGAAYRTKQPWEGKSGNGLMRHMKQRLPEGFLQTSTYSFNYENALTMYFDREYHRSREFSGRGGLCEWLLRLPYLRDFVEALRTKKQVPMVLSAQLRTALEERDQARKELAELQATSFRPIETPED
jgi:hypothetical protein